MSGQLPPGSYSVEIGNENLGIRIVTDLRASNRHKVASVETNRAHNRGLRVNDTILAINEQLACNLTHDAVIKVIKSAKRPLKLTLQRSFKSKSADAIYSFTDGTKEHVRVVKAHSISDGGGYTIYINSLQRERHTVEERLSFDLCGDLNGTPVKNSDALDQSVTEMDIIHRRFVGRSNSLLPNKWSDCVWRFGCNKQQEEDVTMINKQPSTDDKCMEGKCQRCGFSICLDESAIAQHGQTCSAWLEGTPIRR
jgi:hypothetical protein